MLKFNVVKKKDYEDFFAHLMHFDGECKNLLDKEQVETDCIKWSNYLQSITWEKADHSKDEWEEEKANHIKKAEKVNTATPAIKSICIGLKWDSGKFAPADSFGDVIQSAQRWIAEQDNDELAKALQTSVNACMNTVFSEVVKDGFRFNLSVNQTKKLCYSFYPDRVKSNLKTDKTGVISGRLKPDQCYRLLCTRACDLLGITAKNKKTVTIDYKI